MANDHPGPGPRDDDKHGGKGGKGHNGGNSNEGPGNQPGGNGGGNNPITDGNGNGPDPSTRPPDDSAKAIIDATLSAWGLGGLGAWAWDLWLNGDEPDEIYLKMRTHPDYIARFPAMAGLAAQGRALSETEYVAYERSVVADAAKYAIPDGIYNTRAAIGALMLKGYSADEIGENMRKAAGVVYGQPEVRAAFAQFYGGDGDGAAIAFFLDPEAAIPALEQKYAAVQIAGNALAQGLNVGKDDAERLALITGASEAEAQRAAAVAGTQRELYANLLGERGQVTDAQGVSAALGADSADVAAVEQRRSGRKAQYAAGGSLAAGSTGVSGLGSANT